MKTVLLIPLLGIVLIALILLVTRRDEDIGHGWKILDALLYLLSWWGWWR
jgi:hypothetical protein